MNSGNLRHNVWALTLSGYLAVIGYALSRADAGEQKPQAPQHRAAVATPKKGTAPAAKTPTEADRIFCGDHTDTPRCCRVNGGYWVSLGAGDPGGCNFHGYNY